MYNWETPKIIPPNYATLKWRLKRDYSEIFISLVRFESTIVCAHGKCVVYKVFLHELEYLNEKTTK